MKKTFVFLAVLFILSAFIPLTAQESETVEPPAVLELIEVVSEPAAEVIAEPDVAVAEAEQTIEADPADDFVGHGIHVGVDFCSSLIKWYLAENISYKYGFRNGIGLSAGVRVMENIIKASNEPLIYVTPFADFWYKHWYFGGGAIMDTTFSTKPTFFVHTGWNLGQWQCGLGRIGINIGLELSPTVVLLETEGEDVGSGLGAALASAFGTIINVPKINLGVAWLLPL